MSRSSLTVSALVVAALAAPVASSFASGFTPTVGSVVVNEYNSINDAKGGDWFELLVKVEGTDLRGLRVTDNPIVGGALKGGEGVFVLGSDPFLKQVPAGTLIAIHSVATGVTTDTTTNAASGDRSMTLAPGTGVTRTADGLGGAPTTGLSTAGDSLTVYLPGPDGASTGSDNVYLDFVSWEDDGSEPPVGLADLNLPAPSDAGFTMRSCAATVQSPIALWTRHMIAPGRAPNTPGAANPAQDLSSCVPRPAGQASPTTQSRLAATTTLAPPTLQPSTPSTLGPGDVVFNEYRTSLPEFVELLVRRKSDLRGLRITDNELVAGKFNSGESVIVFGQDQFLANVPAGTLVAVFLNSAVLAGPTSDVQIDTDASDYGLVLAPGTGLAVSNDGLGGPVKVGFGDDDALFLYTVGRNSAGPGIFHLHFVSWRKSKTAPPTGLATLKVQATLGIHTGSCSTEHSELALMWGEGRVPTPGGVNQTQDLSDCGTGSPRVGDPLSSPSDDDFISQLVNGTIRTPVFQTAPSLDNPVSIPAVSHNNGMAVTGRGQIVGNYQMSDTIGQIHIFNPGSSAWKTYRSEFAERLKENRFPSGMQAEGQLLAVADNRFVNFHLVGPEPKLGLIPLKITPPAGTNVESVGFVYHRLLQRYIVALPGSVLYASTAGEPMTLPNNTLNPKFKFTQIKSTGDIPYGEAGLALLYDPLIQELVAISFGPKGSEQAETFEFRSVRFDASGTKATIGDRGGTRIVPSASGGLTFGPSFRWGATATIVDGRIRLWAMPRRQSGLEQLGDYTEPAYWDIVA